MGGAAVGAREFLADDGDDGLRGPSSGEWSGMDGQRPLKRPPRHRPGRRGTRLIAALAVGIAVLGACSSDDGEKATTPVTFCRAVEEYAEQAETGDAASMADALTRKSDELPDADRRVVEAHITALTAVSSNHPPEDSRVEDDAEAGFRRVAAEHCGDDVLPPVSASSTPTSSG